MVDTLALMQTSPRPYHHGDLRAALLARAEETLREKGTAALSLRELARDIGVSHAAPSRHFKDKQALLDALALVGYERMTSAMAESQADAGETFPKRLDAIVRTYVGFCLDNVVLLDLMYSIKHDPEASAALRQATQKWSEIIERLVVDGQRDGEVREGSVERVGIPIFAALHGYADLAATGMLAPEITEHGLDEVIAFMLRGCAPDGRA